MGVTVVFKKRSFVRMIGFSDVLKAWMTEAQQTTSAHAAGYATVVRDLALALHRFDKLSKPMGRAVVK